MNAVCILKDRCERHLTERKLSYKDHAIHATRMGFEMIRGGAALLLHALVPAWFPHTGSDAIRDLYFQYVVKHNKETNGGGDSDRDSHQD